MVSDSERVAANPFDRQWAEIESDVAEAVGRVGRSGWYILGGEVRLFERAFGELVGAKHVVGCANGLDAIEIALRAAGMEPGDEVLTTPLSAFATTLAIVRAGGLPVFVDTDETGLIDLDRVDECLAGAPTIKYLVPVHLFGQALDLSRLETIANTHSVHVIEDAAQAVLARSGSRRVGAVGRATTYSFYPTKNLGALGDGGCLVTDDEAVAAAARSLRDYGQSAKYQHSTMGLNSRLDELHAAILRDAMLPRLPRWTERRVAIAERYRNGLHHPLVRIAPAPRASRSVHHLYPVLVDGGLRDGLLHHLQERGVQAGVHYPSIIPDQPALSRPGAMRVVGSLECARRLASSELSLPIHPTLRDEEVDRVIEVVNGWKP